MGDKQKTINNCFREERKMKNSKMEECIKIAKDILEVIKQLEKKYLVGKEELPKIKEQVENFLKNPTTEDGEALIQIIRGANAHMETEAYDKHILDHKVTLNAKEIWLGQLLQDFQEALEEENGGIK